MIEDDSSGVAEVVMILRGDFFRTEKVDPVKPERNILFFTGYGANNI